jgi:3-hydroxyisobutyrate dehydrogenase
MTQRVGIAGTGRMGTAFARRLIETGSRVLVWNRTPARLAPALDAGAQAAELAELARCDAILLVLTDAAASRRVIEDLARAGLDGALVLDLSTHSPAEADALSVQATAAGAEFVHCPVGGTVGPALKGQLLGLAGGSAAAVERARPLLDRLCRRVEHVGKASDAARMKLAINLPLVLYWQTLGEALGLLRAGGVSDDLAISLIADSSAGPAVLKTRGQIVLDTLARGDQTGTFDVEGLMKDLRLALDLGTSEAVDMPLAKAAVGQYRAAIDAGLGRFDGATITRRAARR